MSSLTGVGSACEVLRAEDKGDSMGRRDYCLSVLLAGGMLLGPSAGMAQRPRFSVSAPIPIEAGDAGPHGVAIADLDKDGRLDIVVVSADEDEGPVPESRVMAAPTCRRGGGLAAPSGWDTLRREGRLAG